MKWSLFAVWTLFFLVFRLPAGQAEIVEKVVAIVNDQVITQSDIEEFTKKLKSEAILDQTLMQVTDAKALSKDRKALIDYLIDEKIMDSEVKRKDLALPVERIEKEIRSIAARNRLSRNELKAALTDKGIDFAEYQAFIKTSLERQALIEREITSKIRVSDEDVAAEFAKETGRSEVYQYQLSHIFFKAKNGGDEAARKRAQSVLEKMDKNLSFEQLVKQYSEDPGVTEGGAMGTFKSGELYPDMETAVRDLRAGQHSGVVKGRNGYHILKLNRKTLVADPELEKKKAVIEEKLRAQTFRTQFKNWLQQRRQESFIRIN